MIYAKRTKSNKAFKRFYKKMDFSNPVGWTGYYDTELKELQEAIETVLNMLKEKDKEIERLEKQSKNLDKQAQQYFEQTIYLDKQIDLMAEYIARLDIDQDICIKVEDSCFDYAGQNGKTCEECIKQYFENKAKGE